MITCRAYACQRKFGCRARVYEIDFAVQDQQNGLGSDWQPSVKMHEITAETPCWRLESDLGWKAQKPVPYISWADEEAWQIGYGTSNVLPQSFSCWQT